VGKKLILLPQTIGPFKGAFARKIARYILRGAERIYGRDRGSVSLALALRGEPQDTKHVALCYDVGFILDAITPKNLDTGGFPLVAQDRRVPIVGLNVSGLLWSGGYTRNNMFGLRVDYKKLILEVLNFFILEKGAAVLLIPHVFGTGANSESDELVCHQIWETLSGKYGARLGLLSGTYDQSELKYVIGLCDFFVGSRMHACIAAVSQGVPAVSVAYSDKFVGVMETIGMGSNVADARYLSEQEMLPVIERAFDRRFEIRRELLQSMPKVRASILSLLDPGVHARRGTSLAPDPPEDAMLCADVEGRVHVN
jgi:polysaccharide pyruvyl transferase WcaK-like protein